MNIQPRKLSHWLLACILALFVGFGMLGCGSQESSSAPTPTVPGGGTGGGGSSGGGAAPGAPVVTFTVDANTATVSNAGTGGVTLTADVTLNGAPADTVQVTFTVMTGSASVGPVAVLGNGSYSAMLTDTVAEDVVVFATARDPATGLATDSGMETVTFTADAPASMTLLSDRSTMEPVVDSAQLTVTLSDQFGNPVSDVVDMTTDLGQLSSTQVTVTNGIGYNTLTAADGVDGVATIGADYNSGALTQSLIIASQPRIGDRDPALQYRGPRIQVDSAARYLETRLQVSHTAQHARVPVEGITIDELCADSAFVGRLRFPPALLLVVDKTVDGTRRRFDIRINADAGIDGLQRESIGLSQVGAAVVRQ